MANYFEKLLVPDRPDMIPWPQPGGSETYLPDVDEWPAYLGGSAARPGTSKDGSVPWVTTFLGPEIVVPPGPETVAQINISYEQLKDMSFTVTDGDFNECPNVRLMVGEASVSRMVYDFWSDLSRSRWPTWAELPKGPTVPYLVTPRLVASSLLARAVQTAVTPRYEDVHFPLDWRRVNNWTTFTKISKDELTTQLREWVRRFVQVDNPPESLALESQIPAYELRKLYDWCWVEQLTDGERLDLMTWSDWQLKLTTLRDGWVAHGALPRARFGTVSSVRRALDKIKPFCGRGTVLHEAAARLVVAQSEARHAAQQARQVEGNWSTEEDLTPPPVSQQDSGEETQPPVPVTLPVATVFTTSFDLLLEKELSKIGAEYLVVMPVYTRVDGQYYGLWLARHFEAGEEPARESDSDSWFVLSMLSPGELSSVLTEGPLAYIGKRLKKPIDNFPVVVHLMGCPLLSLVKDSSEDMRRHIETIVGRARVGAETSSGKNTLPSPGIFHAPQLTENDVFRWAMVDTAGRMTDAWSGAAQVTRFTTALPISFAAGLSGGQVFRYWAFAGVPFGDSATRFSVMSQILGADFINGDATPKQRGLAVGAFRMGHRAAESLKAENIYRVVGESPEQLAPLLDHYRRHLELLSDDERTRGLVAHWPQDSNRCQSGGCVR